MIFQFQCPNQYRSLFLSTFLLLSAATTSAATWQLESTSRGEIPIPNTGTQQTACLIGDIDGDGRDDVIIAERTQAPSVTVFFRHSDGWQREIIDNTPLPIEAGGDLVDIDGDGDLDISFGGDSQGNQLWWWENPGAPFPATGWTRHLIKSGGSDKHHDQAFGDFDGDGELELAFWNQEAGGILFLADFPADPLTSGPWPYVEIFNGNSTCEGLATGDINLDGKIDLVGAGYWFEHISGTNYSVHVVASGRNYTRSAVGQLVPGGRPEVVIVPGDTGGPLIWYEWDGAYWAANQLDSFVDHGHSLDLGDVNRDGLLDIFNAEMHTPGAGDQAQTRIFYNLGNGEFDEEIINIGLGNHESRLADVNGDSWLDIVGKPYTAGTPGLNVWLQEIGPGGAFDNEWTCLLDEASAQSVNDVSFHDINGNGQLDVVAQITNGGLSAFYNGTWNQGQLSSSTFAATAWADVDIDGYDDLIAATTGPESDILWLHNPGASPSDNWAITNIQHVSSPVTDLAVGDLQNHGLLDLVVFASDQILSLSSSNGETWAQVLIANPTTGTVGWLADIDRDGDQDVGYGNTWWRNDSNSWLMNSLPGSFTPESRAWAIDPDQNGWSDLLVVDPTDCGTLHWLTHDGSGNLQISSSNTEMGLGSVTDLITLDVDRDGFHDLVLAGLDCANLPRTVLLRSDGGPLAYWTAEPLADASTVAAGDVDHDGALDLVLGTPAGQCRLSIAHNLNTTLLTMGSWSRHVIDSSRPWRALFVLNGDLDRDGDSDIISGGWWYENPGAPAGLWTRHTLGSPLNNAVLVHDFDRDGDLDILGTAGQGSDADPGFSWAENNGNGAFTLHANIATGDGDFLQGVAIGRFTNQPINGIVPESIALSWHGQDNGIQMLTVPEFPAGSTWAIAHISSFSLNEELQAGDLDRDGDLDLSLGTAWLRNEGTSWTPFTISDTPLPPDRHRLRDMDNDGRLDLIVGVEAIGTLGPVTWYRQPTDPTSLWTGTVMASVIGPMSLDAGDLDLDGDLDIVVGEHQTNNPSSARLLVLENAGNDNWTERLVHVGDEHHDGSQLVDIDNDGDLDIISIGWFHDNVVLYENLAVNSEWLPGDVTPPRLVLARSTAPAVNRVVVRFSEPVNPESANLPDNYHLVPSTAVIESTLQPDGQTVHLLVDTLTVGTNYEIHSTNVQDLADIPNSSDGSHAVAFVRAPWSRIEDGLLGLWDFAPGVDSTVFDVAPGGQALDLVIADLNSVTWTDDVLQLNTPVRVASVGAATKINTACQLSGEVTLEAWAQPSTTTQMGPARIVTVSTDRYSRNATLAQGLASSDGDRYSTRLRTTETNLNGLPTLSTSDLAVTTQVQHIVMTRGSDEMVRIYVDGELLSATHRPGSFSNWDINHGFAVGGEFTFDEEVSWLGGLHMAAVYDRALSAAEIQMNLNAGPNATTAMSPVTLELPTVLLSAVMPNPFNARLALEIQLSQPDSLTLAIYDLRGRKVRILSNGETLGAGPHMFTWDGTDDNGRHISSGTYLVRARTSDHTEVRKVVLAK